MDILLPELFYKIRDDIFRITDIRNLSRVCKKYDEYCKKRICELENFYYTKYSSLIFTNYLNKYSVEKYTVELILDECYNLLPVRYFNKNNDMMCPMLAFMGNFELLKGSAFDSCPVTDGIIRCAAFSGSIDILEWSKTNLSNIVFDAYYDIISANAFYNNKINVLEWMRNNNYNILSDYSHAIKQGHLDIIIWLKSYNNDINESWINYSAMYGQLHILQWLHINNLIKTNSFTLGAVSHGHEHILQWALDQKYEIHTNEFAHQIILKNGHTNVLEWLTKHNIHFNKILYTYTGYSKKTFTWALTNGYKFDDNLINDIIVKNNLPHFQWIIDVGHKMTDAQYKKIFESKNIKFLELLFKNDLSNYPIMIERDENKHIYLTDVDRKIFINIFDFSIDVIHLLQQNIKNPKN